MFPLDVLRNIGKGESDVPEMNKIHAVKIR
jgi:hypothetical protein